MNKITIQGRLTKDVELGHSQSGNAYARFGVAVDRRSRKDEEKKTDFFDCVAFSGTAEFIDKYFGKGDGILINGRMESNQWTDRDGNKRLSWSLSVDDVEFPLGKRGGQAEESQASRTAYGGTSVADAVAARNAQTRSESYDSDQKYEPKPALEAYDDGDVPF